MDEDSDFAEAGAVDSDGSDDIPAAWGADFFVGDVGSDDGMEARPRVGDTSDVQPASGGAHEADASSAPGPPEELQPSSSALAGPVAGSSADALPIAPRPPIAEPPSQPAAGAPPAAAAAAAPSARRRRGRRDAEESWLRFEVPGYGELIYNPIDHSFGAHCSDPRHDKCRLNRTCNASNTRSAQGRPIGYLVTWLLDSGRHGNREAHFGARRADCVTRLDVRIAARAWFKERCPNAAGALSKERPQGCDPNEEPPGVP